MLVQASSRRPASAHVVVLGNEKGGAGKSTLAMHVAVALLNLGQRVATVDLDLRQKSLTCYVENRRAWAKRSGTRSCPARASLRAARHDPKARRERDHRVFRLCRHPDHGRADPQFHRRRHRGQRQPPDPPRPFHGQYADHAAQRQLRGLQRARHRRSGDLFGRGREPLRPHGARGPPAAAAGRRRAARLGGGAQSRLVARIPQHAAHRPRPWRTGGAARLPHRRSARRPRDLSANSFRAGSPRSTSSTRRRWARARRSPTPWRARS